MSTHAIVIAHRGASGYLPEHTLPAYALAYGLGADYLEPDVVASRDGVLLCCHDIHLDRTTDVAQRFPERARDDGRWYAADFDWDEIAGLCARERANADGTRVYAGRFMADATGFAVPRLADLLALIDSLNRQTGGAVGVYPETKAPRFHAGEGLSLEAPLLALLAEFGYAGRQARVFIQSFEAASLKTMRHELGSDLPMIQLVGDSAAERRALSPAGLDAIAAYADGIGPAKSLIYAGEGALVRAAHERGLAVHPWTFRADDLAGGHDTLTDELTTFIRDYGVDGVFTDFCDVASALIHPERPRSLMS